MQAILKSNHDYFFEWLRDAKSKGLISNEQLENFWLDLEQVYGAYLEEREQIRKIIKLYEEKQKLIRNEIRLNKRISDWKQASAPSPEENDPMNAV